MHSTSAISAPSPGEIQCDAPRAILAGLPAKRQKLQHGIAIAIDTVTFQRGDIIDDQQAANSFESSSLGTGAIDILPAEAIDQQRQPAGPGIKADFGRRKDRILNQRRDHPKILFILGLQQKGAFVAVRKTCVLDHQICSSFTRSICAPTSRSLRTTCS